MLRILPMAPIMNLVLIICAIIWHLALDKVQRELTYAIVDEVDSILIDEARTPLIISGPAEESSELYIRMNTLIPALKQQQEKDGPGDFTIDEKVKASLFNGRRPSTC